MGCGANSKPRESPAPSQDLTQAALALQATAPPTVEDEPFAFLRGSAECTVDEPHRRGLTLRSVGNAMDAADRCCADGLWINDSLGTPLVGDGINLYHLVDHLVKPATKPRRCSYAEFVMESPEQQVPSWFVSHSWGQLVREFIACLKHFCTCQGINEDSSFWVCAYCLRQHCIDQEIGTGQLLNEPFAAALLSPNVRGTVMILDDHVSVFTRAWCCCEAALTISAGKRLDLTTARRGANGQYEAWMVADGPTATVSASAQDEKDIQFPLQVAEAGMSVTMETCQATRREDLNRILNHIAGGAVSTSAPPLQHENYIRYNSVIRRKFASIVLSIAIRKGDAGYVRKALVQVPNIDLTEQDVHGRTHLQLAQAYGTLYPNDDRRDIVAFLGRHDGLVRATSEMSLGPPEAAVREHGSTEAAALEDDLVSDSGQAWPLSRWPYHEARSTNAGLSNTAVPAHLVLFEQRRASLGVKLKLIASPSTFKGKAAIQSVFYKRFVSGEENISAKSISREDTEAQLLPWTVGGSSKCDIQIPHATVAPVHFELDYESEDSAQMTTNGGTRLLLKPWSRTQAVWVKVGSFPDRRCRLTAERPLELRLGSVILQLALDGHDVVSVTNVEDGSVKHFSDDFEVGRGAIEPKELRERFPLPVADRMCSELHASITQKARTLSSLLQNDVATVWQICDGGMDSASRNGLWLKLAEGVAHELVPGMIFDIGGFCFQVISTSQNGDLTSPRVQAQPFEHGFGDIPIRGEMRDMRDDASLDSDPMMEALSPEDIAIDKGESGPMNTVLRRARGRIKSSGYPIMVKISGVRETKKRLELASTIQELTALEACPNLTQWLAAFVSTSGVVHTVQEYVNQGSLQDLLHPSRGVRFSIDHLACVALQILTGLQFLHAQSLHHGCVRPSNILLSSGGVVKLADFGIQNCLDGMTTSDFTHCYYVAPEMQTEDPKADSVPSAADIWSSGVVFHELATGSNAYSCVKRGAVIDLILRITSFPEPRLDEEAFDKDLCRLVASCLLQDVASRSRAAALVGNKFVRFGIGAERIFAEWLAGQPRLRTAVTLG